MNKTTSWKVKKGDTFLESRVVVHMYTHTCTLLVMLMEHLLPLPIHGDKVIHKLTPVLTNNTERLVSLWQFTDEVTEAK